MKQKPPPGPLRVWDPQAALAAAPGDDGYAARLARCDACPMRHKNRCMASGDYCLSKRLKDPDFTCPGRWTPDQPSRGLGDTVAKATHAVGVRPCGGCKRRQEKLNEWFPYPRARAEGPDVRPHLVVVYNGSAMQGGGTRSWAALIGALDAAGFRVTLAPRTGNRRAGWFDDCPNADVPQALADRPAAVLANLSELATVYDAAREANVPVIAYVQFWRGLLHCSPEELRKLDEPGPPPRADPEGLRRLQGCAAVAANSPYTAEKVAEIVGRPVRVIQPMVADCRVADRDPRYVLLPSGQQLKGLARFLTLAKANPEVRFLLLAHERKTNAQGVRRARRLPNVEVRRAWVDDMRAVYRDTRALFLGTETAETFSRVSAECRANGIPILALAAGNLPHIVGPGGVCVPRDASDEAWQAAFEQVLAMEPEPTEEFCQDHRGRMVALVDAHRRLAEIAAPVPAAPGIQTATLEAVRVLGVTGLPWHAEAVSRYALALCSWDFAPGLDPAKTPTVLWWHSNFAQMDTSVREQSRLAKIMRRLPKTPELHVAFSCQADADLWQAQHPGRVWHLPVVMEWRPTRTAKTGGVFLPGPYVARKNVTTALAACAIAGQPVHVTDRITQALRNLASELGVELHVHRCPAATDLARVAGSCDAALMLSTAETFCYAAAETVMAGTPVVAAASVPAVEGGPALRDPSDPREAAAALGRVLRDPEPMLKTQQQTLRRKLARHAAAARATLLGILSEVGAGRRE